MYIIYIFTYVYIYIYIYIYYLELRIFNFSIPYKKLAWKDQVAQDFAQVGQEAQVIAR